MKYRYKVDIGPALRAWLPAVLAIIAPADCAVWGQDAPLVGSPDQSEKPTLPSKEAPPPRQRLASLQPLGSGAAPLPPGLTNTPRNLGDLPSSRSLPPPGLTGLTGQETVVKVVIDPPLKHNSEQTVRRYIKTIADRPYDVRTIEEDVKKLENSKLFLRGTVNVEYQRVGERGIVVIYHLVESPTIKYLRFFGQVKVKERHLRKQSGMKVGESLDAFMVKDGASKVEEYYHEKGFNKATVKIIEGTGKDDRGVVYAVNEGQKQKVEKVEFEGNK
ncbi:MAG: POTRA domain-containing protein, partial [Pirellulales bacterium]